MKPPRRARKTVRAPSELSGHGHFDLASYDAYLSGRLQDYEHPGAEIAEAMETLP